MAHEAISREPVQTVNDTMGLGDWFRRLWGSVGGPNTPDGVFESGATRSGSAAGKSGSLHVRVGAFSDRGRRENNEDNYHVGGDEHVYMVADGMGGQAAGEIASQYAVEIIPSRLNSLRKDAEAEEIQAAIAAAFIECNEKILAKGATDSTAQNLGTTAVVLVVRHDEVALAHIGDSQCYRMRDQSLELLTEDHSLAEALRKAGTITAEEVPTHRYRNVLYRFVGMKESGVEPDFKMLDAQSGDRWILASDGVTGSVSHEEMTRELLNRNDPQSCAAALVRLAIENGSKDNATCVALFFDAA
jgi:protein phosphatase